MQQLAKLLGTLDDFSVENQKKHIDAWVENTGIRPWNAWRVALVGTGQGPDMYDLSAFLGKEETLNRIHSAIKHLG